LSGIVDLKRARMVKTVRRAFRNWVTQFGEPFGEGTGFSDISTKTLAFLVKGNDQSAFYFFDLIMNLQGLGSGFEFNSLTPKEKLSVMDRYLFLLDRVRFEHMKRLGWLDDYPGAEMAFTDLVFRFDGLAPRLQAETPSLSKKHPAFPKFSKMRALEREEFIRKLIPEALKLL
jgi:hypothetical protein